MNTGRADERGYRLSGIDMLRGLAIVIMAIDHVRDFFMLAGTQDPMTDPNVTAALFATRWITHFCAPVFVCLAGTSAGLMTARKSRAGLARFLALRGLWLIVVEWFVIATAFTFSPGGLREFDGHVLVILQVIWAIGASMIVLAVVQGLGRPACLALGVIVIAAHNLLDPSWPRPALFDPHMPWWVGLHAQGARILGPFFLVFAYPLLPWTGVMLFGFGLAPLFELPAARRDAWLRRAGFAMVAAFVVLRAIDVYGDPHAFRPHGAGAQATVMALLNTTKYPPSLLYLLMTLGPAAVLCSYADRIRGRVKDALVMFGRVPFAFYVAHFYLIHALSVLLGLAQGFRLAQMCTLFAFYPRDYGLPLAGVYAVWALVLVLLYPLCRAVAGVKAVRRDWWLSYV